QDPEVQKHAAQILRNMLRQEEAELQRFQELLSRNPGAAVEEQLEGARRRVHQLQLKIQQESQGSAVFGNSGILPEPFPALGFAVFPKKEKALGIGGGFDAGVWGGILGICAFPAFSGLGSGRPPIIGPEEDCEAGYSNNESDSPFQDLGRLKSRPAHLGVFLRFLFSQADPVPLLFYLCSDVCCQQSNPKDSRALGRDIWNLFLDRSA
ncbi:ARHGB factor, partial [Machaerirhynchus nigripectus]|nr:ARHGB factor [Machaerirhynchus nigripectus]